MVLVYKQILCLNRCPLTWFPDRLVNMLVSTLAEKIMHTQTRTHWLNCQLSIISKHSLKEENPFEQEDILCNNTYFNKRTPYAAFIAVDA